MPDIDLKRLRDLRRKAEELASTLVSDLKPFRHPNETNGFCRRPDSQTNSDDINVTTTCSCLMALSLSDKLSDFFGKEHKRILTKTFGKLVEAPWMSSGLTENNAFTATLVFRLFGFLQEAGDAPAIADAGTKLWESELLFKEFKTFATKLADANGDSFSTYLFGRFPAELQKLITEFVASGKDLNKAEKATIKEIERLIGSADFYDAKRLEGVKLSEHTKRLRERTPNSYIVAQLNRLILHDVYLSDIEPIKTISLEEIAFKMRSKADGFKINEYPPAAAVIYWFVDGIDRAGIELKNGPWEDLYMFAAEEFRRQRSLVVASHDAMMDPVAMGMSACLCARLRSISKKHAPSLSKIRLADLPSNIELESSIVDLFNRQTLSGIWPKFFPLFHYQDAGSNFCFTFELLEAVLVEFGGKQNKLLIEEAVVRGLERAILWCDTNRLHYREDGKADIFKGWNSGGNLETLKRGQPESWATAVVHMFLWELVEVLSRHIQNRLLETYEAKPPLKKWKTIENLLDIELWMDDSPKSLKSTLRETILKTFNDFRGDKFEMLRKKSIKKSPLSALLFGPPGTSKTEVAKAIARDLDWPLVEIDPSHFLKDSFQNIYVQAERIFADVMDLTGVVLLFDEMDALVQKRDDETKINTESKFLTTYMLPKLAKLHDKGRLVFLMATNFQAAFDDAIKRAGRFDLLLCMGPPTLKAKCDGLHLFYDLDEPTGKTTTAGKLIEEYTADDPWVEDQLYLYTYGEFLSFITGISENKDSIDERLASIKGGKSGFAEQVKSHSKSVSLKMDDLAKLKAVEKLKVCQRIADYDKIDFSENDLAEANIDKKLPAIKYILDRKQTRRQFPKSA